MSELHVFISVGVKKIFKYFFIYRYFYIFYVKCFSIFYYENLFSGPSTDKIIQSSRLKELLY